MRLFVAVDVDAATREGASRFRDAVARKLPSAERGLRWVAPDNLHMTLRFIGEVDEPRPIEAALAPPFDVPPFLMRWGGPAWIPAVDRPRVLVVRLDAGAAALASLAALVAARLEAAGVEPETRPFLPHLTLARVRDHAAREIARHRDAILAAGGARVSGEVAVSAVALYESRLSPAGPAYTLRLRTALGGRR
jgi:2'-5' RNA ligase